jgi:hypothetical protein
MKVRRSIEVVSRRMAIVVTQTMASEVLAGRRRARREEKKRLRGKCPVFIVNDRSGRNHGKSQKEPNRNQKEEEEAQQGLSCGEEHSQRHAEAEDQPISLAFTPFISVHLTPTKKICNLSDQWNPIAKPR